MRIPFPRAATLVAGILLSSAAFAAPAQVDNPMHPVTVLFSSNQCGSDSDSLEWVTDPARLEVIRAALAAPGAAPPPLPTIDPATETVLLLSMGTQPTPGYQVSPGAELPTNEGRILRIPMHWRQPPAGVMLPQVITTPCLLFSVASGDYDRIDIIDQQGQLRLSANAP